MSPFHCQAPNSITYSGNCKLPVGRGKPGPSGRAPGSQMGLFIHHRPWATCQREAENGIELLSYLPPQPPCPTPWLLCVCVVGGSALAMGTSGSSGLFPMLWGRGGNRASLGSSVCFFLPKSSYWCLFIPLYTYTSAGGGQGEGGKWWAFPSPTERNWGRGRGEWRR